MIMIKPPLKLSIWEERLCAHDLLFEVRAAVWKPLAPRLLIEPPSFETPGGNGVGEPCHLTAICPANRNLETRALEVALIKSEYKAFYEIEAVGNWEE